jgi:glucokinase
MEVRERAGLLGIEIGGTKLQLVLGNDLGQILQRTRLSVCKQNGALGIQEQIEQALPALLSDHQIAAVGVGFGGPVDWKSGRVARSHHIEGWSGFELSAWLGRLTGAQVSIDNDANVAALGEASHGAGIGFNPVFYVTLGSGVGGGLVVDGKIYHGATPGECEIGHVRLDRSGTIVEARCSGWAVDARLRALRSAEPTGILGRMLGNSAGGEAQHLRAALDQGDLAARRILEETSQDLAFGLSHVVQLFHPQIIILGGGLSGVGEPLRAAVEAGLRPFVMEAFAPDPRVALARLGEDAVPVGALELARRGLQF